MPYSVKHPPKELKRRLKKKYPDATAKQIRLFVHVWNSVFKESKDESKAFASAWSQLKRSMKKKKASVEDQVLELSSELKKLGLDNESEYLIKLIN